MTPDARHSPTMAERVALEGPADFEPQAAKLDVHELLASPVRHARLRPAGPITPVVGTFGSRPFQSCAPLVGAQLDLPMPVCALLAKARER